HYKLKADEKRFFAHLPPNFPEAEFERAKRVYAGILTANHPESVEKYLTPGDKNQPEAGKVIHKMFDLATAPGKNYFQEGEESKREKISELERINNYILAINSNAKLRYQEEKIIANVKKKKAAFLNEKKIAEEIIPQYQENPSEENKKKIPIVAETVNIPGAEHTTQALRENTGKGKFFENLMEELDNEHFCYLRPDKVTGKRNLPKDRTKLVEEVFPKDRLEENPL
ncbi:23093_t:CDS:2, partial [Racocetra persica]